jgi:hypothetical protein
MSILPVGPVIPDLHVPRMEPCSARISPILECGATPASLYSRYCTVPSHERKIWLCPIHAAIVATGGSICRECADAGGISPVLIVRITGPIRM